MLALLVALTTLPPQRDVPFIVFPVLLWAAIRFGPRGAATAILVVCSITVCNTAQNDGPFVRESITNSLLATQLFIATSALTSLLLAAVTAERTEAEEAASSARSPASRPRCAGSRRWSPARRAEPRVRAGDQGGRAAARRAGREPRALRRGPAHRDGGRRLERGRAAAAAGRRARSTSRATP